MSHMCDSLALAWMIHIGGCPSDSGNFFDIINLAGNVVNFSDKLSLVIEIVVCIEGSRASHRDIRSWHLVLLIIIPVQTINRASHLNGVHQVVVVAYSYRK